MTTQAIQIVHLLPSRVRVKFPRLKGNAALASEVQHTLATIDGIHHVEVSSTTGSVLVLYDPHLLESCNMEAVGSLMALADRLGLSIADIDLEELQDWLHAARNGLSPGIPGPQGNGIGALFDGMNTGVAQATKGWGDLRTLVPLTLCFLGFRSLLLAEQVPFPSWYDYFWFAFGTFVALHPSRPVQG